MMENESPFKWTHLGDGVYALYDGYHVVLRTSATGLRIYLDPSVINCLVLFLESQQDTEALGEQENDMYTLLVQEDEDER